MIWWMAQGFVTSALLAAIVWTICRWRRIPPAARHLLWLVVLVKLLMPPVLTWSLPDGSVDRTQSIVSQAAGPMSRWERARRWLAQDDTVPQAAATDGADQPNVPNPAAAGETNLQPAGNIASAAVAASRPPLSLAGLAKGLTLRRALLAAWLTGGLVFAAVQAARTLRMRRLVRTGSAADPALADAVAAIARQMKIPAPSVQRIGTIETPCIFSIVRPRLLWPATLPSGGATSCLIAHELAHLKRRDHWISWLELAAGFLWWWSPVYWLARRELRASAELSCDACTVQLLPAQRRDYAHALLDLCERRTAHALPAVSIGIAGDRRILHQRLIQIMEGAAPRRLTAITIAIIALMFAAAVPACSLAHDLRDDLPFSMTRDTTYLTNPIGPDGTPDYYAALNARYGNDVTPANNGFVIWLEKVNGTPASDDLAKQQLPRLLKMCGANPSPGNASLWQSYNIFLPNHSPYDAAALRRAEQTYAMRQRTIWTAADDPLLAQYLAAVAPQLTAASIAADQPHWWIPDVGESMDSTLYSLALTSAREVSLALSARAMLHAGSGDINATREDIITMKRLARKFAASSTGIEWLTGYAIERIADDATASIACSAKFSANDYASLQWWLDQQPPFPDPIHTIDIYERYDLLHLHIMAATDPFEFKKYMDLNVSPLVAVLGVEFDEPVPTTRPAYSVNARAVDWNRAMRTVNQWMDTQVKMMRTEPYAARHAIAVPLDQQHDQWLKEFGREPTLHPQPAESRDAYTDRLSHSLIASVEPSFEFVPTQYDELCMRTAMAHTLLFLAQGKASLGTWPVPLPTDTVSNKPLLPRDIFSAAGTGTQPVHYTLSPDGPRLYSIGPNGIDDGGNADDIALPARVPPPAAAPIGSP